MSMEDHKESFYAGTLSADEFFVMLQRNPDVCARCFAQGFIVGLASQLIKSMDFMSEKEQEAYFLLMVSLGRERSASIEQIPAGGLH